MANNYMSWPASRLRQDENNRLVTDVQIAKWDNVEIPEAIKNPNALSIQLNGGTAKTYDGSAVLNINITPTSIGAAASDHTHIIANITGLQDALNSKAASDHNHDTVYSKLGHTHTVANITDFPTSLPASDVKDWAKADTKPVYTFAEITEKPETYAPSAHKHKDEDIESISASKITGTISIENLPKAALERCVPVKNDTARFALTTDTVQLGDTVKVEDTGLMYLVVDESKLNSEDGYQPYTAAAAASVPWTGVTGKPDKFTPDTHTHAIADVTGLQDALDGKATKDHVHDSEKVVNWNNAITSGAYYAAADATNNPSADAAYSGNVVKGATIVTQTVVKETVSGDFYEYIRRGQLNEDRTAVTTWGEWQEIQYVVAE